MAGNSSDPSLQDPGAPQDTPSSTPSPVDGSPGAAVPPSAPLDGGPDLAAPQAPPPPRTDWRDRRIGEQQARIRDLRAQLERFQQSANAGQPPIQGQPNQAPYGAPPPDRAAIDREIEHRAALLASQQEFTRRCNDVADVGRQQFNDFDVRINKLVGLVDGNDPNQVANYNGFLSAAMETGDAARLLHHLGGDLDEAARILSLTPIKMAVELTRMSNRSAGTPGVPTIPGMPPLNVNSGAPRPINPAASMGVNNRSVVTPDDPNSDNLSTPEWMARREQQVVERRRQRG